MLKTGDIIKLTFKHDGRQRTYKMKLIEFKGDEKTVAETWPGELWKVEHLNGSMKGNQSTRFIPYARIHK